MKLKSNFMAAVALSALLAPALSQAAETIVYDVAHVRHQDVNMVFVKISPNFFNSDAPIQAKWYKAVQSCMQSKRLDGSTIAVSDFRDRFMYYGPNSLKPFVSTVNMKWVNARVNKKVTCIY